MALLGLGGVYHSTHVATARGGIPPLAVLPVHVSPLIPGSTRSIPSSKTDKRNYEYVCNARGWALLLATAQCNSTLVCKAFMHQATTIVLRANSITKVLPKVSFGEFISFGVSFFSFVGALGHVFGPVMAQLLVGLGPLMAWLLGVIGSLMTQLLGGLGPLMAQLLGAIGSLSTPLLGLGPLMARLLGVIGSLSTQLCGGIGSLMARLLGARSVP